MLSSTRRYFSLKLGFGCFARSAGDLVQKIIKTGIPQEEVFYYSSGVESAPILHAIKLKKAKMLLISPEALLLNNNFVTAINEANASRYLKNIIIDEAHIVVDWGADFRIDYQCLESWRKKLLLHNPLIRTILLSATFERRCRDILKQFFSEDEKWIEISTSNDTFRIAV